jgi:hypothetical protein
MGLCVVDTRTARERGNARGRPNDSAQALNEGTVVGECRQPVGWRYETGGAMRCADPYVDESGVDAL